MSYIKNIKHIYEQKNLAFSNIKEIFSHLAQGKLETYEKIDGANLLVSYNFEQKMPIVARSISDVKNGGLTRDGIINRFENKNIEQMFLDAYDAIKEHLSKLSEDSVKEVFPVNKWISTEIISKNNRNIINYDENHIIFHKTSFCAETEERILENKTDLLFQNINEINSNEWKISPVKKIETNKLNPDDILDFTHRTNMIKILGRVQENSTLEDYYQKWTSRKISSHLLNFYPSKVEEIADYIVKKTGHKSLNEIKKSLNLGQQKKLKEILLKSNKFLKEIQKPLEFLVQEFSNKLLKNVKSNFIQNHNDEVDRQRKEILNLIENLKKSKSKTYQEDIEYQIEKFKTEKNLTCSCEGVVFNYNGNIIKLEGNYIIFNRLKYFQQKINEENENLLKNFCRITI